MNGVPRLTVDHCDGPPPIGGPVPVFPDQLIEKVRYFVQTRPEHIRVVAEKYPPGLYLHQPPKPWKGAQGLHRVFLIGYDEQKDDTITARIIIMAQYNPHIYLAHEREVFGVPFNELQPIKVYPL